MKNMNGMIAVTLILLPLSAIMAHAQEINTQQMIDEARQELEDWWYLRTTVDNGSANPAGTAFVESATAVRGWSLALNTSSTLDKYQFPLTLATNIFQHLGTTKEKAGPFHKRLRQSEISATYTPLIVQRKVDQSSGLDISSSRTGAAAFKMALVGVRDIDDFTQELSDALGRSHQEALRQFRDPQNPRLTLPGTEELIAQVIRNKFMPTIDEIKARLERQFRLSGKVNYEWDSRDGMPDSFTTTLIASKGGFTVKKKNPAISTSRNIPLSLSASLSNSWIREDLPQKEFGRIRAGLGTEIGVMDGLSLGFETSFDHYSGSGFPGISGVDDLTEKDDLSLIQALRFKLPNGQKLEFAIKETHINTGDIDVALSIGFGVKLFDESRVLNRP